MTGLGTAFVRALVAIPRLVGQLTGVSKLPLYELDRENVREKSASSRIRPFKYPRGFTADPKCNPYGQSPDFLTFTAWNLAHAIKKADYARRTHPVYPLLGALGFLIEHLPLFRWTDENLRLDTGMARLYGDFSRTSTSGRVAQGMAYLFMNRLGYAFGEHLSSLVKRAEGHKGYDVEWGTRGAQFVFPAPGRKIPDFIFEKPSGDKALTESKGGFVAADSDAPNIKGDLREALSQMEGWDEHIIPTPKQFAVGTYLREYEDPRSEPSLIAFVDPDGRNTRGSRLDLSDDTVRRGNYAGWLESMGFSDAAHDLRERRKRSEQQPLSWLVLRLGDQKYAVRTAYVRTRTQSSRPFPFQPDGFSMAGWHLPCLPSEDGAVVGVVGLHLPVLRQISRALANQQPLDVSTVLRKVRPQLRQTVDGMKFDGSVFLDGSILGELSVPTQAWPRLETEEVAL